MKRLWISAPATITESKCPHSSSLTAIIWADRPDMQALDTVTGVTAFPKNEATLTAEYPGYSFPEGLSEWRSSTLALVDDMTKRTLREEGSIPVPERAFEIERMSRLSKGVYSSRGIPALRYSPESDSSSISDAQKSSGMSFSLPEWTRRADSPRRIASRFSTVLVPKGEITLSDILTALFISCPF